MSHLSTDSRPQQHDEHFKLPPESGTETEEEGEGEGAGSEPGGSYVSAAILFFRWHFRR